MDLSDIGKNHEQDLPNKQKSPVTFIFVVHRPDLSIIVRIRLLLLRPVSLIQLLTQPQQLRERFRLLQRSLCLMETQKLQWQN